MSSSPTTPGQTSLIPMNDCILVLLDKPTTKETKYSSRTSGIVERTPSMALSSKYDAEDVMALFGKRVHFEEFKEGGRIKRNGEQYSFIKLEDVRGSEDV